MNHSQALQGIRSTPQRGERRMSRAPMAQPARGADSAAWTAGRVTAWLLVAVLAIYGACVGSASVHASAADASGHGASCPSAEASADSALSARAEVSPEVGQTALPPFPVLVSFAGTFAQQATGPRAAWIESLSRYLGTRRLRL